MSSPQDWVWDAFSLYDSLYRHMPPFLLRMNTKTRKVRVESSKFKRMIWCLNVILYIVIILGGSCIYVVVKWLLHPKSVFADQAAAALGMLMIVILASYTCMVHYVYREDHVLGVNILLQLHISQTGNGNTKKRKKGAKEERDLKQILLGLTMKCLIWGFWIAPAIAPIAIFEGLDPLRIPLQDMVPLEWMDKYPVHIGLGLLLTRFVLLLMIGMELSRFFAVFFLLFISGIVIYIDCIDKFIVERATSSERLTHSCFIHFVHIRMIIQILSPILRREICCLMFTGFLIALGANVGSVQCYNIFPWYMYFAFVSVFFITMIIIYCTLPFGTEVNEKSAFALEKWKNKLSTCDPCKRLLLRKTLKGFAPLAVRCGPFFKLKQETKCTYFEAIFNTSCDFNISVDIPQLFENGVL